MNEQSQKLLKVLIFNPELTNLLLAAINHEFRLISGMEREINNNWIHWLIERASKQDINPMRLINLFYFRFSLFVRAKPQTSRKLKQMMPHGLAKIT